MGCAKCMTAGIAMLTVLLARGLGMADDSAGIRLTAAEQPVAAQPSLAETTIAPHSQTGMFVQVGWINWRLRDAGMEFAAVGGDPVPGDPYLTEGESLDLPRDNGLRLGLGYRFASRWDVAWNYTYFHTNGRAEDASAPGRLVFTPGTVCESFEVDSAAATANFTYNVHDLEFGRWINLRDNIELRLFGGFRWARTRTNFDLAYTNLGGTGDDAIAQSHSEMDAYGLRLGTEYRWRLGDTNFSIVGSAAGSVLAGNFRTETIASNLAGLDEIFGRVRREMHAVPVLEASLGIGWQYRNWELVTGYELATWMNESAANTAFCGRSGMSSDILLDGLFARVSYRY